MKTGNIRDAVITPIDAHREIVITTDGCTGVGLLDKDFIHISMKVVAGLTARVALMEIVTQKAIPVAYSFNHIANNDLFFETQKGFIEAFEKFGFYNVPYVASSEKNFKVYQTSITISITGLRDIQTQKEYINPSYIVIGDPLVGQEILDFPEKMITPKDVLQLLNNQYVYEIIPCGSGGIYNELKNFGIVSVQSEVDLMKSAGPASCALVIIDSKGMAELKQIYGSKFHEIKVKTNE